MSELKIINTKQYNSELDEVCKNETDIFIKTKLTRRVTFGEYQFEPKNGFETDNAYYSDPINLDECEVYYLHQPTLNDNQQVLLKWLKKKCDDCAFIPFSPFPAIRSLYYLGLDLDEIEVRNIIDELNRKQQAQVLQVFSQWVLEQEDD